MCVCVCARKDTQNIEVSGRIQASDTFCSLKKDTAEVVTICICFTPFCQKFCHPKFIGCVCAHTCSVSCSVGVHTSPAKSVIKTAASIHFHIAVASGVMVIVLVYHI